MDGRVVLEGEARHAAVAVVGLPAVLGDGPLLVVGLTPVEAAVREHFDAESAVGGPVDVLEEDAPQA